jgi:hypothetical protein
MFDLLYIIAKLFFTASLSILLLLYFPARLVMYCCLRVKHEKLEKLNDLRPYIYYALGSSILFVINGLFSPISVATPLYIMTMLGLLGVSAEIYNKNILFDKHNIKFLLFFFIIFLLCFGQYILHSLGHDDWYYLEMLRSYHEEGALPVRGIAGFHLPVYGLLIPVLNVLSLGSFPLMAFVLMLFQALLLTILFMSIFSSITKFKQSDLLLVFLLLTHSYLGNFAAHQIMFLVIAFTLVVLMSEFSRDPRVQFCMLLLVFFSALVHPSAVILGFFVLIMVVLAGRINFKIFVGALVFFTMTTVIFLGGNFGRQLMLKNFSWTDTRPTEVTEEISVLSNKYKVFLAYLVQKYNALYNIVYRSFISKNGNWRLAELSLIYFALLFFRKHIYS